ncbi:cytochrome P450 [Mycena maculata]|uniref:Cytochrome P450 n=1 Tax=Mycena maculata TaxID=230809 RepID=A0AAD7INU2_9AGAR|nr:cytochrome P450 [Mycena maculata]
MLSSLQSAGLVLISFASYLVFRFYVKRRRSPLPPGPRGLPLVGNLYDIPKRQEWLSFMEMSRIYDSDIISLNLMGTTVIVLNSQAPVDALLEERSIIYSDRPSFTILNKLVGFKWHFGFMSYGAEWKNHRKAFMQQFRPSEVLLHRPAELEAARTLLQRLLESPVKYERHLRHMAGMVILSTTYGIDVEPEDDPYIDISEMAVHAMSCTINGGSYLVDSLPFLRYVPGFFPGAGFQREAREWSEVVSALREIPYAFSKRVIATGTSKSSVASRVLEEIGGSPQADDKEIVLKNILATCYADTTVSALGTFILAMTMYPDIQKKAQAAIEEVVGQGRLPDFDDKIPYIDALVREVLRWRPVAPLAIPHAVTKDDVYMGYHIPAGSVVIGNSWYWSRAILHDEATFGPNTKEFIPERWLTQDGKINLAMRDHGAVFGYGRRVCPGQDMAQWSIWICIVSILATLDIRKCVDQEGVPIEPSGEYIWGFLCYPVPHICEIVPRSEAARAMIRSALQD